ncbi:hypothetical protein B0T25DRAFT_569827 [Lasiosphaeria hispida]|uniref:Uncharacterized protein n=1 Tax=Lasiosphaeria hispida TaxID=260671 RepID=A0AAJ0MC18_9PEZI|nr:hypothetical protein B0T25DRAFT_569827 [Lasiosphaeria hispida]
MEYRYSTVVGALRPTRRRGSAVAFLSASAGAKGRKTLAPLLIPRFPYFFSNLAHRLVLFLTLSVHVFTIEGAAWVALGLTNDFSFDKEAKAAKEVGEAYVCNAGGS